MICKSNFPPKNIIQTCQVKFYVYGDIKSVKFMKPYKSIQIDECRINVLLSKSN